MESLNVRDGRDFRAQEKQGCVVAGKAGWKRGYDDRSRSQKGAKMLRSWLRRCRKGPEPRNIGGVQKLKKARHKVCPRSFGISRALPTSRHSTPKLVWDF